MDKGDLVQYLGCSIEQVRWGNNDDPRSLLIVGRTYQIEEVNVRSQHTKVKLYNKMGMFNSVCFRVIQSGVNSSSVKKEFNMDPNDIELQSTAKSFAYEKIARDIDKCEDIAELQKISKCYAKLYFKQQETMTMIGLA